MEGSCHGAGMEMRAACENFMKYKMRTMLFICAISATAPAFAQDSGAAALGRAVGTLLGNLFGGSSSGTSGQGPAFNDETTQNSSRASAPNNQDQPTPESMNAFKERESVSMARQESLCTDEKFKPFFLKSPCQTTDITIGNISDKSKATAAQKKVIEALDIEYLEILKMRAENYRENIKPLPLGLALSNLIMQLRTDSQSLLVNLYQEKITWGQFNEGRRDLISTFKKNFDAIIAPR
jgi:hypothetical protein